MADYGTSSGRKQLARPDTVVVQLDRSLQRGCWAAWR